MLDDCYTDDRRSILSKCADKPRVRIVFNAANSGSLFKYWNADVKLAFVEYVWIAESGDYADERCLEKLVARFDAETADALADRRSFRLMIGQFRRSRNSDLT